MYRNQKITVYFPCRNEQSHLHTMLSRVPKFVDEVIVVSNKSTDNTLGRARELGAIAIEDNQTKGGIGYGFAHMTGLARATGDIIATADGDLTYPIEKLGEVIDRIIDGEADFISCNRYPVQKGTYIPLMLQIGVTILNLETRILYWRKINDILSGMWVLKRDIRDGLRLTEGDWNLSPQIKLNAMMSPHIRFAEHSICQNDRAGETKQAHWKTGFQHLWWIFKNRFR